MIYKKASELIKANVMADLIGHLILGRAGNDGQQVMTGCPVEPGMTGKPVMTRCR